MSSPTGTPAAAAAGAASIAASSSAAAVATTGTNRSNGEPASASLFDPQALVEAIERQIEENEAALGALVCEVPSRYILHEGGGHTFAPDPDRHTLAQERVRPALDALRSLPAEVSARLPSRVVRQTLLDALPSLPADLIDVVQSFEQRAQLPLQLSDAYGRSHWDSRPFHTLDVRSTALLLSGWTLRRIVGFGGEFVNGVQLVLGPPHAPALTQGAAAGAAAAAAPAPPAAAASASAAADSAACSALGYVCSVEQWGRHHFPVRSVFDLSEGECVTSVSYWFGDWGNSLRFVTSLGRQWRIGSSDGGAPVTFAAPPGHALVGMHGATGGHMHALGVLWAPQTKRTADEQQQTEEEEEEGEER